ncbi:hypothetical protein CBR_g49563 [Chara braunii]|uniref:Phosphate transporter n=1 Tax=Chara braunii TaxID=69332 RepID=A0A388M595_CHABU|nr:hypothetical protein CBR_g49563 [Chara braunii]|eukprot:GBG89710.1 hypothetical protein CBR_g49563 [Chara braunii]
MAAESFHLDTQYYWVYIVSIIVSFAMAWAIGANDVANSFGTSVGSGALTMKQAVVIAWVFEFCGAFFLGGRVVETLKGGIVPPEIYVLNPSRTEFNRDGAELLMWGMFNALLVASTWIILATYYGMPISTTHSIIGAIIGFSIVAKGSDSVTWYKEDPKLDMRIGGFVAIVLSWVLTPFIGAVASMIVFGFTKRVILRASDAERRTLIALPFYYGITALIITFFIVYKGSPRLKLQNIGNGKATLIACGVGVGVGILAQLIGIPLARRRLDGLEERKARIEEAKARKKAIVEGPDAGSRGPAGVGAKTGVSPLLRDVENNAAEAGAQHHLSAWQRVKAWYFMIERKTVSHDLEFTEHTLGLHARAELFDERAEELFSFLQILTACAAAFAHGSNDTANAIGPLSSVYSLYRGETIKPDSKKPGHLMVEKVEVESWMLAMGGIAIGLGFAVWGWRMVRNLGGAVTMMTPSRGFTAELCAALTVVLASRFGMPISTTQTLVGATIGVGASDNWRNVDWVLFGKFVFTWVMTIAFAGLVTAGLFAYAVYSPSIQP